MLLLVTWTAVASAFRYFLPPSAVGRETVTMLTVFVVLALVMSVMLRGASRRETRTQPAFPARCTPAIRREAELSETHLTGGVIGTIGMYSCAGWLQDLKENL
jgi:hypothetical protein